MMSLSIFATSQEKIEVPNIILKDQYGKEHNLKDYKGKVVLINFWTTWCPYCVKELPYLEKASKEYSKDLVILGIAGPRTKKANNNPDIEKDKIIEFLKEKGVTYPILFEETGKAFVDYRIRFFPISFVLNREGNFDKVISGAVTEESLKNIIEEAIRK